MIDRAFYREAYDYRETLRQSVRTLNRLMDPDTLAETVLSRICETMAIRRGYFYALDDKGRHFIPVKTYPFSAVNAADIWLNNAGLLVRLLRSAKRPILLSDLQQDDREIETIMENLESVLAVPIAHKAEISGIILLSEKRSDTMYSTEDLDLLATLSDQVAIALENGRLHEQLTEQERLKHELGIARKIQMNSLPRSHPVIKGYDIFGCSFPAYEVGGDYFDYLPLSQNKLGLVVGDVSGKGTSAALYMSKIQGFFKALLSSYTSPVNLLTDINRLAFESMDDHSFMTLSMAVLSEKHHNLKVVRAGHPAALHFSIKDRKCFECIPQGMALALDGGGLFEKTLKTVSVKLMPGDTFLMVSDGILEAENSQAEEFGENRLQAAFVTCAAESAEAMGRSILDAVKAFTGDCRQKDDMTVIILKRDIF